jgi:hypothetical protein
MTKEEELEIEEDMKMFKAASDAREAHRKIREQEAREAAEEASKEHN